MVSITVHFISNTAARLQPASVGPIEATDWMLNGNLLVSERRANGKLQKRNLINMSYVTHIEVEYGEDEGEHPSLYYETPEGVVVPADTHDADFPLGPQ